MMRKNNMLNKQVIKAISIAISAGMLLQPMQALADSAPVDERPDDQTKQFDDAGNLAANTIKVDEKDVLQTDGYIEKAVDSADAVATAILPDGDDDPNKTVKDKADQEVKEKAGALAGFTDGADGQKLKNDSEDTDAKVRQSASDEIAEMDNADIIIAGSIATGNKKAAEANAADKQQKDDQKDAETLAQNTTKAVSDAQQIVTEQSSALSSSQNESEAVSAYNAAVGAIGSADAAVNAAEKKFDEIEKDFKQAETNYNNAKQAADTAQGELNTARENFKNAKQAAINLTGGDDDESLDGDAEIKLAALEQKVNDLKGAADVAYQAYLESGYAKIIAQQKLIEEAGTLSWNDNTKKMYRDLCVDIIKFYYLPGEGATVTSEEVSWTDYSGKGGYLYEDGTSSSKADVLNYGTINYVDKDGNPQTLLFNYKTFNGNNGNGKQLVIFEKTEHTVLNGKDLDFDADTLAALDKGEVVDYKDMKVLKDADGNYVGYAESDGGQTLVVADDDASDDNKTVSIDDDSKQIEYTVEDGKLIKKVTADVTTTTYTENNLAAAEATLASEAAAKEQYVAAMKAKVGALKDGEVLKVYVSENQIVTYTKADLTKENVNWEAGFAATTKDEPTTTPTVTGYKVSGTYVNKFADHLRSTRKTEQYYSQDEAIAAAENPDFVNYTDITWHPVLFGTDYFDGTYELSESFDSYEIKQAETGRGRNKKKVYWAQGKITVEYANVKSALIDDYYFLLTGLNDGTEDQRKEAVKKAIEDEGGIFVDFRALDGNIGAGSIIYVPGNKVTKTYDEKTLEEAKAAFENDLKDKGNVSITGTEEITSLVQSTITKYGYSGVKALVELAKSENVVISTETWAKALGAATTEYRNDNWYTGDVILSETINGFSKGVDYTTDGKVKDANGNAISKVSLSSEQEAKTVAFNEALADAAAVGQMYLDTMDKANTALTDIRNAKAKVAELTASIKALKATAGSIDQINALSADLTNARAELDAAIRNRNSLKSELTRLDNELQRKLEEFRPVENPENNEQPAGPAAPAPVIRTVANAPAPAVAPEVEIEEENAPLAENPGEVEIVEEEPPKAPEVTVTEEATPTSPVPEAETEKPSWLWLLIILALGTTGAELYRRHLLKQKALKAEAEQNNINK